MRTAALGYFKEHWFVFMVNFKIGKIKCVYAEEFCFFSPCCHNISDDL